jgi:hypothetical protein
VAHGSVWRRQAGPSLPPQALPGLAAQHSTAACMGHAAWRVRWLLLRCGSTSQSPLGMLRATVTRHAVQGQHSGTRASCCFWAYPHYHCTRP